MPAPSRSRLGFQKMANPIPLAYLITVTCYGTRLHGDQPESVDNRHNVPGSPFLPEAPSVVSIEEGQMSQRPYLMDRDRRPIALRSLRAVCTHRGWTWLAAHVRSTHVHVVVTSQETPEKVMNALKSYASRALNQARLDPPGRRRWAHHGSTRYLWKPKQVAAAIEYVVWGQGNPMAVWRKQDETLE